MNRRKLGRGFALLLSLFLIFTSTIQSTLAFVATRSDTVVNTFIPFQSITNDLVINKVVEHPYGADYNIPDNIAFDFEVNLGSYYAGSTIETTNGDVKADENGKITVTAKANTSVGIKGIEEGTKVTVTEMQRTNTGFSVKDGQTTKEATIAADGNTGVDYINVYQPESLKLENVKVRGTKELEGGYWQEGYTYTFILEQEIRPHEWSTLGTKTITYDANNQNFNQFDFSDIFSQMEIDQLGTYNFRISEVKGEIENITYDETIHNFSIVVSDHDMDGKIDLESIVLDNQPIQKDAQTGKYNLEVKFTNQYTASNIEVPITVDKTMKCENTKASVGPDGFQFVLENVDTREKLPVQTTDAQGDTVFKLGFTADDVDKTFNYKLYEVNDGRQNIVYDTTVYHIQIKVELSADNKLVAHVIYEGAEVQNFVAGFINRYDEPNDVENDEENDVDNTIDTGDHNLPVLWGVMFVVSTVVLVTVLTAKRRRISM